MNNQDLDKLGNRLQKILKLSDWDIKYELVNSKRLGKNTIAQVDKCFVPEKKALILINEDYQKEEDYESFLTLEHIILHELIHVLSWAYTEDLPTKIKNNKKVICLEEFICDSIADIIYNLINKEKV